MKRHGAKGVKDDAPGKEEEDRRVEDRQEEDVETGEDRAVDVLDMDANKADGGGFETESLSAMVGGLGSTSHWPSASSSDLLSGRRRRRQSRSSCCRRCRRLLLLLQTQKTPEQAFRNPIESCRSLAQ